MRRPACPSAHWINVVINTYQSGHFFQAVPYASIKLFPVAFVNRKAISKP
jgi:hypothetical protein